MLYRKSWNVSTHLLADALFLNIDFKKMDDNHIIATKGRFFGFCLSDKRISVLCFLWYEVFENQVKAVLERWLKKIKEKSAYVSDDAMNHTCNIC